MAAFLRIAALGVWLIPFSCAAQQLSEESAKHLVCQFVRLKSDLGPDHFLRATRREELEDDLFSAQVKIHGQIRKAALFFEVSETGYEVVSPNEALLHSSTDGQRFWQVAIDPVSKRLFGVGGFGNADAEGFNSLALAAKVSIDSPEAARGWAALYIRTVLQGQRGLLLSSETDLKRRVEDIVAAYRLSRKRSISVSQWLKDLGNSKVKPVFGIEVTREDLSFRVVVDALAPTSSHEPAIIRSGFRIAPDGRVSDESTRPLFPLAKDTAQ